MINSNAVYSYHANVAGTGNRAPGNPAGTAPYSEPLPPGLLRVHLFIQNKGNTNIDLTMAATGSKIRMFPYASISVDNYVGGFSLNSYTNASIQEAFAE